MKQLLIFDNQIADAKRVQSINFMLNQTIQQKLESLILAQNERWRRA